MPTPVFGFGWKKRDSQTYPGRSCWILLGNRGQKDVVFTANTVHIISWTLVQALFRGVGRLLPPGGSLMIYGPFNYGGDFTSDSNARFDQWLKDRDAQSGIRNFEDIDALARNAGLELRDDIEMPANNRILVWKK